MSKLANRTTSSFPLSVGTSLALESIFETTSPSIDPERVIPQKVNIGDYDEFWLNIGTLFRNMFNALAKEDVTSVFPREYADALHQELETIISLLANDGRTSTQPIFYLCDYTPVSQRYARTKAYLKVDNTTNQFFYSNQFAATMRILVSELAKHPNVKFLKDRLKPDHAKKALVQTHVVWDLLSHKNFASLDLIESHTGVLKPKTMWYTKYQNGKELSFIPFMQCFFPVFGDNELFRQQSSKFRQEIIDLAKEYQWSAVTTKDRIALSIEYLKNPMTKEIMKSFL
jgi:hypothetical protein